MADMLEKTGERVAPGEVAVFADSDEAKEQRNTAHLAALGETLQVEITQRVADRAPIEQRMLMDLRQYNGIYEPDVAKKLNDNKHASNIFVKLTKSKTNFAAAQILHMGAPSDERNWDIRATPVPRLVEGMSDDTPVENPNQPGSQAVDEQTQKPITQGDLNSHEITVARDKAKRMRKEIDDQLIETKFPTQLRKVIRNAAKYGTGILKGPQVTERTRTAWIEQSGGKHKFQTKVDRRPVLKSVSPWHFFPDLSTNDPTELDDVFERHMLTKSQLRKLAKQPGFLFSQIRKVIEETEPGSDNNGESLLSELYAISELSTLTDNKRFRVWEYHGPLKKEDLEAAGIDVDLDDEMEEFRGVVWMVNGIVIKVGLNLMDSNALPYYVMNWETDETTVFGYGVPYALRDPQKIANASWRMVMDNAGLSTGPQIFMRKNGILPADGVWQLTPRKLWYVTDDTVKVNDVVKTVDIPGNFDDLFAIYEKALEMAEQDSNLPKVSQGQQTGARETFSGLALRTNISNLPQRDIVKNLDDNVMKPVITNMYDYNMQFNKDDSMKGDYEVHALGSDVLIAREIQAQVMLQMMQFASDEVYGPWMKPREMLIQALKSNHVNTTEILKTQEEFDKDRAEEKANQQPPQPTPDATLKAETALKQTEMNNNTKLQVEAGKTQMKMFELESQMEALGQKQDEDSALKRAEINLKLEKLGQERDKFVAELRRKDHFGTGI